MTSRRLGTLAATIVVCAMPAAPAAPLTEQQARAAVESFMAAWNTRSPAAFAATLQYPHVRPAARGGARIYPSAESYAATVDFDAVVATGWDHSEIDSLRVVHLGEDKAHVAGRYTRARADGSAILSNQVSYVVARGEDGSIGIRARFAAGRPCADAEACRLAEQAALETVKVYMEAFNARDEKAWAATFNYPHVRVAGGSIRSWRSAEEYEDGFDFASFAERYGWHHSAWDEIEAVQVSTEGVNVALTFSRFDDAGRRLSTFHTLYLVTLQDGHWGVRARSSFAP